MSRIHTPMQPEDGIPVVGIDSDSSEAPLLLDINCPLGADPSLQGYVLHSQPRKLHEAKAPFRIIAYHLTLAGFIFLPDNISVAMAAPPAPGNTATQSSITSPSVIASTTSAIANSNNASASPITSSSPAAVAGQGSTTSSPSITSVTTSPPSSAGAQRATSPQSTTTPHSSSTSSDPTSKQTVSPSHNNRLSNGAVAGIVIGVALGLALLTFLATFLIMRRRNSKRNRRSRSMRDSRGVELNPPGNRNSTTPKKPVVTERFGASGTYENYLSQSADDGTIQQKVKSTLDQIELHVENFYRNSSSSAVRPDDAELAVFNSPYLPAPLASLLPRSNNRVNIIKHALAQSITSSISPSASSAHSLLPAEYALLPSTVSSARSSVSNKAGKYRFVPSKLTERRDVTDTTKGSLK